MCEAKPGPRCSRHTYDEVLHRKRVRNLAEEKFVQAEQAYSAMRGTSSNRDRYNAKNNLDNAYLEVQEAVTAEATALKAWYSTPDGQSSLETRIEIARQGNNHEEAQRLAELLEEGRTTRRYQRKAQELVKRAEANIAASESQSDASVQKWSTEIAELSREETRLSDSIVEKNDEATKAEITTTEGIKSARKSLAEVTAHHETIKQYLKSQYEEAGISANLAESYATDSIASLQEGWHYHSDDSGDRFPKFQNELHVKVKSGNEETYSVKERLHSGDEQYHQLMTKNFELQESYVEDMRTLDDARDAETLIKIDRDQKVRELMQLRQKRTDLQQKIVDRKALVASGLTNKKCFPVETGQFVQSSYVNSDGSTNAFVFLPNVGRGMSMYVPVESVTKSSQTQEGYVQLQNGERISARDLKKHRLMVIEPQEKSRKLFA